MMLRFKLDQEVRLALPVNAMEMTAVMAGRDSIAKGTEFGRLSIKASQVKKNLLETDHLQIIVGLIAFILDYKKIWMVLKSLFTTFTEEK